MEINCDENDSELFSKTFPSFEKPNILYSFSSLEDIHKNIITFAEDLYSFRDSFIIKNNLLNAITNIIKEDSYSTETAGELLLFLLPFSSKCYLIDHILHRFTLIMQSYQTEEMDHTLLYFLIRAMCTTQMVFENFISDQLISATYDNIQFAFRAETEQDFSSNTLITPLTTHFITDCILFINFALRYNFLNVLQNIDENDIIYSVFEYCFQNPEFLDIYSNSQIIIKHTFLHLLQIYLSYSPIYITMLYTNHIIRKDIELDLNWVKAIIEAQKKYIDESEETEEFIKWFIKNIIEIKVDNLFLMKSLKNMN